MRYDKIIYFIPDLELICNLHPKKQNNVFLQKTMPVLLDDTYNNILSLLEKGNSIRDIAKKHHVSKSKIQKIHIKHFPNLAVSVGGCPKKLSLQNKHFLVREITSGRSKTGVEARKKLKADLGINVCDNTVRNTLREAGVMIEVFSVREGVEVVIRIMYLITNHGGLYT